MTFMKPSYSSEGVKAEVTCDNKRPCIFPKTHSPGRQLSLDVVAPLLMCAYQNIVTTWDILTAQMADVRMLMNIWGAPDKPRCWG